MWLSTNSSYPTLRGPPTFMVILVFTKFSITTVNKYFFFLKTPCSCSFIHLLLTEKTNIICPMRFLHFPPHLKNLFSFCSFHSLWNNRPLFYLEVTSLSAPGILSTRLFQNCVPFLPFLCCIVTFPYY